MIPKTLAALPNSQYATILSLVCGKKDDRAGTSSEMFFVRDLGVPSEMVLVRLPSGDEPPRPLPSREVVVARRICNAARFHLGARMDFGGPVAPLDAWRGAWQVKNCLESRGAACRRRGRL